MPVPDPNDSLGYVIDAIRKTRGELGGKVPLIGFSGSPWTLACYMVEGSGSKDFAKIKGLLFSDPQALHTLLAKKAEAVALYLNAQIKAGVQAVMIFDTWGVVLSRERNLEFSLAKAEVKKVLDSNGDGLGNVFNLGHGIQQFVGPEYVGTMLDCVRELSCRSTSQVKAATCNAET